MDFIFFWGGGVYLFIFFLTLRFWNFRIFYDIFWDFLFYFLDFFSKLLRLLLKVTEVTTEHQKWLKVSQNSLKNFFLPEGQKKPRPKAKAAL